MLKTATQLCNTGGSILMDCSRIDLGGIRGMCKVVGGMAGKWVEEARIVLLLVASRESRML